jgi:aminocarboxymuconate-semialdehyde decarboxylase
MLDKYPGLKLVLAHGGGSLPYLLGRLRRVHEIHPSVPDPTDGFAKVYFDSVVLDGPTLHFLVELAGASQVMLGSDYPFANGDPDPRTTVEHAQLGSETLRAVLGGNAKRVFQL